MSKQSYENHLPKRCQESGQNKWIYFSDNERKENMYTQLLFNMYLYKRGSMYP